MKNLTLRLSTLLLAMAAVGSVHAAKDDMDVARLTNSLDQLSRDPSIGTYAQAEQARARDAVNQLAQARSRDRAHALYIAERRVDLARATAQLQDAQLQVGKLDREHDQIQLDGSRREADMARRELERQRLQYQAAQEESARQLAAGAEAAAQAQAQADQAKKLAAAQAKVANAAKKQADLAAQAARAMRQQMQGDSSTTNKDQGK
jgi:chromosome segregation ATPase